MIRDLHTHFSSADGQLQPACTKSRLGLQPGDKVWIRHIVELVRERSVAALFAGSPTTAAPLTVLGARTRRARSAASLARKGAGRF